MNTETLILTPQKVITATINLTIAASLLIVAGSFVKSPPLVAKELRIAQGSIVTPLLEESRVKEDLKNITPEQQADNFNQSIKNRYKNGFRTQFANKFHKRENGH